MDMERRSGMAKVPDGLRNAIDEWVESEQIDDSLKMWISDTLVVAMAQAAWGVLEESRNTQKWLKTEGHMRDNALLAQQEQVKEK